MKIRKTVIVAKMPHSCVEMMLLYDKISIISVYQQVTALADEHEITFSRFFY